MINNQFYKMPADLLQAECIKKMLKNEGALSQFGLTMLMWFTIQGAREKKISKNVLQNMFRNISSCSQRNKALESGMFLCDTVTEIVSINPNATHAGVHTPEHAGEHTPEHTPEHAAEHTQVPIFEDKDIELKIEGDENTHTHTQENFSTSLILDLSNSRPDRGEIWEGVLLCCPDQSLRKMMVEHWPETVQFFEKHLKATGRMAEAKDLKSLCDILRELVQPSNPVFGGLKLFLEQECKSETERKFDAWLSKLSNILMMQEPLTYSQFGDLVQLGFPAKQVRQTAERLNNYSNAYRKYSSAFLTIKDWLEHPLPGMK